LIVRFTDRRFQGGEPFGHREPFTIRVAEPLIKEVADAPHQRHRLRSITPIVSGATITPLTTSR